MYTCECNIARKGRGYFVQSGGNHTTGNLYIGCDDFGYSLSGGQLTTGATYVGYDDTGGGFTQSGGSHTAGNLYIGGGFPGSNYGFANGSLTVTGTTYVGYNGSTAPLTRAAAPMPPIASSSVQPPTAPTT